LLKTQHNAILNPTYCTISNR